MKPHVNNTRLKLVAAACAIVIGVSLAAWFLLRSDRSPSAVAGQKEWFTVDDGKTWFADDRTKTPPFQRDGKTAYGCVVMTSQDRQSQWVAYLFRIHPTKSSPDSKSKRLPPELLGKNAMEVKRPGTGDIGWVSVSDPRGIEIITPVPRNGRTDFAPLAP